MDILCYGDSNTFGYDPRGYLGGCYDSPWPQFLAECSGWTVRNHGENGREIPQYKVNFPKNIDLLIIMLGTNDLLQSHSPEATAKRMAFFLEHIEIERSKILLIAPPPMKLGSWVTAQELVEASRQLARGYQELSQRLGIRFTDAARWDINLTFDGVHFTENGHRDFAKGLYEYLNEEGVK